MSDEQAPRPVLRVVRGDPTPEQLAALVIVVTAAGARSGEAPTPLRSTWGDRVAAFRTPLRAGPGGWRATGWHPGVRTRAGW